MQPGRLMRASAQRLASRERLAEADGSVHQVAAWQVEEVFDDREKGAASVGFGGIGHLQPDPVDAPNMAASVQGFASNRRRLPSVRRRRRISASKLPLRTQKQAGPDDQIADRRA